MVSRYAAYRRDADTISPEVIDRILIGACAAVWLVWLGVSVAAVVALVDLGRGFHKVAGNSHTTWVLYTVIIVSALIIAGAVPVLLRARRMSRAQPAAEAMTAPSGGAAGSSPPRLGPPGARLGVDRPQSPRVPSAELAVEWSSAEVDRVWLRGTVLLAGTIGIALIAVGAATYLMAVGHDGPSWVCYGLAGAVTAVMPAVEWLHVRQLRRVSAEQLST
jgi:hypothetical protein